MGLKSSASVWGALVLLACTSKTPEQRGSVAAVARPAQLSHPVRWSAKAIGLDQFSQIDTELSKAFEDAVPVRRGSNQAVVTDCASCLEFLAQGYEPSLSNDLQVFLLGNIACPQIVV